MRLYPPISASGEPAASKPLAAESRTRKASRAASATETLRGCFCSHASNSSLLFILASGASRHQRPFAAFSMAAPPRFGKPCR